MYRLCLKQENICDKIKRGKGGEEEWEVYTTLPIFFHKKRSFYEPNILRENFTD